MMPSASVSSGQNDFDQNDFDQNDLGQSELGQSDQNPVLRARVCLEALSAAFESNSLTKTPLLARLQAALTEALAKVIKTDDMSDQPPESLALCLEKQAHLLWLCNQCTYYLSDPHVASSKLQSDGPREDRVLWQIRSVVWALTRFRLIVHLRSLFPGKVPTSIAWRDILPGFKLWLRR
ncbi:MAG: hypothetical protein WA783_19925 [Phormidesmis sp.]